MTARLPRGIPSLSPIVICGRRRQVSTVVGLLLLSWACSSADDARIRGAEAQPDEWLTHGRTYSEQRFSPLDQINDQTVARLGLAWTFDTGGTRVIETTPLVVDGVMYATGSWSRVFALDAATGRRIWTWDPKVERRYEPLGLLRRPQSRRCVLRWQGLCRRARRSPRSARREDRHPGLGSRDGRSVEVLHHHRRTAHRQGSGDHRQRRRGIRPPGVRLRLRYRQRRPQLARLHGARRPVKGIRVGRVEACRHDLDRRVVEGRRRRRNRLGFDRFRSRPGSAVRRHRQRHAVEPALPKSGRRRQSLSCPPSSRSIPTTAVRCGTTRRRRRRTGTIRRHST